MRAIISLLLFAVAGLTAAGAAPALRLEAATDREFYLANAHTGFYVGARLIPEWGDGEAVPSGAGRNVVFVVDRSGSMAGEPLEAVRAGLRRAIGALRNDEIVSIVLFGSEVETLLEAGRRDRIGDPEALLARIEPAGGSALYDAINQGAAQLRRLAGPASVNELILLTDGPPTKGPREKADFARLAESLAREGIAVATVGLGPDCDEDLLAALARPGNGRFRYAEQPARLAETLAAEVEALARPVARDVVLSVVFTSGCEDVQSYGWEPATVDYLTVTYRLPFVVADREVAVLAATELSGRSTTRTLASVTLQWRDLAGAVHEEKQRLEVMFDGDTDTVRRSMRPAVMRAAAAAMVSEALQKAIEQLDKGDGRRALRALRSARSDVRGLNADLEDPGIAALVQRLEDFLAEQDARGGAAPDRKVLRSGLFNAFEPPVPEEAARK